MPFISDTALDALLTQVAAATRLDICSQEPATYTEATSTYSKGNKTSISIGAAADRTPNGRKRQVAAITGGSVTATATVTHWALVQVAGTLLWATGALSASQSVTNGNTFSTAAFDIGVADAT
jgi:hypothetical protein